MRKTSYILFFLLCLLLSSCKKSSNNSGYFSFTSTIQSGDKLISTVNELDINTGKNKEIWSHEYFSQYPLMVYDKQFNRVFYSQRTDNKQDELFVYDLVKKQSQQITQGVFAINYILPIDENTVYISGVLATTKYLAASLYNVNLHSGEIIPLIDNDDIHVREIYSTNFSNHLFYSHYSQSELISNLEAQSYDKEFVKPVMEISELYSNQKFGIQMNKTKRSHVVIEDEVYEIYNDYLVNSTSEPIEYIMPTTCKFLFYHQNNQLYCYNNRSILQLNMDTRKEEVIYYLDYQEGAINNAVYLDFK